ncbi:gamma-glutamyl-gamma-aminobutyrate hydrolase family protein [Thermococcus sp. Bubb.Bath]|nr:gamma-glutamyl-gamma-aminobutyrate hydrolase family protein [Thermococcus sp. Bubb.Bath]NJF24775.1 gamma-glutamyl-gamma-aminobutyrate hydrolase family protein [Thermococcus sp. Bubb.Bath]
MFLYRIAHLSKVVIVKPLIGIIVGNGIDLSEIARQFLVVRKAGGIPAAFDTSGDPLDIANVVDGIVLMDGPDVHPYFYGEDPSPHLGNVDYSRDKFEIELFKNALKTEVPVLGISRGMHIMNVATGGNLYQDLAKEIPKAIKHDWDIGNTSPFQRLHSIRMKTSTHLYESLKDSLSVSSTNEVFLQVNSFHHQGIKRVGEGFKPVAFSIDGIPEAIEMDEGFYIGVQWRPEYLDEMNGLYKAFIEAARESQRRRINRENIELEEPKS